jgi:glutamate racemase
MIGIFDSGLGGLTIVKAILQQLPEYQLLYLGDTARNPYGSRSQDLIYQFTCQATDYLFSNGCELVIVACNTASAEALRKLQQEWLPKNYPGKRVLGVIRPVAEEAVSQSRIKSIGVVGTRATINSEAYIRELQDQDSEVKVFQQACPLLVPLIEEGYSGRPETMKIIRGYIRSLKKNKIDTLILGCTHYPLVYKQFQQALGKRVKVLDSPSIVVKKLEDYLNRHPEINNKLKRGSDHKFLVTDVTENFQDIAQKFLNQKIDLEKVNIT